MEAKTQAKYRFGAGVVGHAGHKVSQYCEIAMKTVSVSGIC